MFHQNQPNLLSENLEANDLKRLVHPELHIDEYRSKMGSDKDICVVSFKVGGKEPSSDLVNFVERGYDYILDADVSSGEKDDGDYLVFLELERSPALPEQIMEIMKDVMNLTDQELTDWRVRYQKSTDDHELNADTLKQMIPLTTKDYVAKYGDSDKDEKEHQDKLDRMKATAGVKVDTKAPKNEYTESLRIAAGLK